MSNGTNPSSNVDFYSYHFVTDFCEIEISDQARIGIDSIRSTSVFTRK